MDRTMQRYHEQRAQLTQLGEHWHEKLWYGSGPWAGDRFLNLYHRVLTDEIDLMYEVPNEKPERVFRIPLADFDIDKLCHALWRADNKRTSAVEKVKELEAAEDADAARREKDTQEQFDALTEKMRWAVRKDTGNHVAPIVVPSKP